MDMCEQINRAEASFKDIEAFNRMKKAIEFKEAYRSRNGQRPSLVSVIALWQDAETKLAELQAKVDELEAAGGPL